MSINRKLGDLANVLDDGTEGQVLSFNASGKIAVSTISTEDTLGTLTQSFDSNQTSAISLSSAANTVPFVSVFKEVPQLGLSSKGQWDVNSNATNYDFYDEKPISYSSSTLTPSATGDGTFTNSAAIVTPYMLSNLSYDSKSFNASTQLGNAEGIAFKSDGTAMYLIGFSNDKVWQYTLSTAYDISTASYSNKSFSVASQDGVPRDVRFKPDGTIMYVIASTAPDSVYQYTLSTAWDVSTASYANKSLNVQSQSSNPSALVLSPDGTKVYIGGYDTKTVFQYNLSTPWDLSTASYSNNSFATTNDFNYSHSSLELNSDASKLFVARDGYEIAEYNMPSDGDVSNVSYVATYDVRNTTVGNKNIGGMAFANNGAKFYIFGNNDMHAYQFSSTTSLTFNAADLGKKVVGNSGSAIITSTAGAYTSVTPFADTSAISSWQLFGAQGKADGSGIELSGVLNGYDIANASYDTVSFSLQAQDAASAPQNAFTGPKSLRFNNDGTKMYFVAGNSLDHIFEYDLSTAWDLSSASYNNSNLVVTSQTTQPLGIDFSSDGTKLFLIDEDQDKIWKYNLSTAWDLSSASYSNNQTPGDILRNLDAEPTGLVINSDGTRILWLGASNTRVYQMTLSTAYDLSTASMDTKLNGLDAAYLDVSTLGTSMYDINISSDGRKLFLVNGYGTTGIYQYDLANPYEINDGSTNSNQGTASYNNISFSFPQDGRPSSVAFDTYGTKMYGVGIDNDTVYQYSTGEAATTYSQYVPALTNSSTGQINSSTWLDINSMTADETKNDGDIFYAVSTDNRASWSVAKASDGVRKIAKNNSGTWQYNNDDGSASYYDLSSASYASVYFSPTSQTLDPRGVAFNSDGTKLYVASAAVWQYSLSSPYDISNPTYENKTFSFSSQDAAPSGIQFNNDGTKLYMSGASNHKVFQYSLSSAYDVSTASYDSKSLSSSSTLYGFTFNNNGTKIYLARTNATITEHTLSTPYDVSTAGSATVFNLQSGTSAAGIAFNSDGTKLFVVDNDTGYGVYQYNLSTAYDISTASYASISLSVLSENTNPRQIAFSGNGSKLFVAAANDWTIDQYSTTSTTFGTSETWVNGTNNNEHATLQEALGAQSFNRMNKAQLDAVADAYHFSQDSADTLDLMLAPYAASGTSPISDGVTINYDAASKYKQAIHGTEYDVEFVSTSSVNLTSKISANFKARVL